MRNIITLLFATALLFSCQKEEFETGDKFKTRDITVEVLDITDSRCPTGAICVWEGFAQADLRISDKEDNSIDFYLRFGVNQKSDTILLDHQIILKDVTPYPDGESTPDQKVTLEIIKQ